MGYIPIRWKGSGLSLNVHCIAHIIIIQQATYPFTSYTRRVPRFCMMHRAECSWILFFEYTRRGISVGRIPCGECHLFCNVVSRYCKCANERIPDVMPTLLQDDLRLHIYVGNSYFYVSSLIHIKSLYSRPVQRQGCPEIYDLVARYRSDPHR